MEEARHKVGVFLGWTDCVRGHGSERRDLGGTGNQKTHQERKEGLSLAGRQARAALVLEDVPLPRSRRVVGRDLRITQLRYAPEGSRRHEAPLATRREERGTDWVE